MTNDPKDRSIGSSQDEIRKLEADVRIAELNAQKAEARVRLLEAEEKVRELQICRAKMSQKTRDSA